MNDILFQQDKRPVTNLRLGFPERLALITVALSVFAIAWQVLSAESGPLGYDAQLIDDSEIEREEAEGLRQSGRAQAENDWRTETAVLFDAEAGSFQEREIMYSYSYDRDTGLAMAGRSPQFETRRDRIRLDAYSVRIRELLEKQGVPAWSRKTQLVPPRILLKYLTLNGVDDNERVKRFPLRNGTSMVLNCMLGTAGAKAIQVVILDGDKLVKVDEASGVGRTIILDRKWTLQGRDDETVSVYLSPDYPKTVLIRIGNRQLIAIDETGVHMGSAIHND